MRRLITKGKLAFSHVLLYYYGKLIGLCPFYVDSKGTLKYSRYGIFYNIILSLTYLLIFLRGVIERSEAAIPYHTIMYKISEKLVVILQCSMVIVSWLVFAFRQRRLQKIVNDIKSINVMAEELEILEDCRKIIRIFRFYTLFLNICFFTLFTITIVLYNTFPNFNIQIWILFNFPHVVFHNILVLFIIAMQIMQWKFHRLNLELRNLPTRKRRINIFILRNFEFRSSTKIAARIEKFGKLHNRFTDLTEEIVDFVSLPILIALITGFLQTVSNVYAIYLFDIKFESWIMKDVLMNANYLIWFLIIFTEMFFLSSVTGSCEEEANNSGNMLHRMRLIYKPLDCDNLIRKVSVQLLDRQLDTSLYGLINLNFQFIYSFCGTITTYLIIMLQFESSKFKLKSGH